MSKHIHKVLVAAAVGLMAGSAMAAGDGTINFTGSIVAASCTLGAGSGTNVTGGKGQQTISVNLGKVTTDSLGGTGGGIIGGTAINLNLNCDNSAAGLSKVKVRFDPASGSGIDPKNNFLLATTGPVDDKATGVGIGLYNDQNQLLNLSGNDVIQGDLVKTGEGDTATYSAKLALRAGYVKSGTAAITAGQANGTLPFTLTYE